MGKQVMELETGALAPSFAQRPDDVETLECECCGMIVDRDAEPTEWLHVGTSMADALEVCIECSLGGIGQGKGATRMRDELTPAQMARHIRGY